MSTVIFDGECPVCTTLKDFTEERIETDSLEFLPFQREAIKLADSGLTQEEASQALYLITENGKRLRGARAVFEVMSQLPGAWGILGRIFRLPPLYWVAEPFYRWFARHRHGVSKFIDV